MMRSSVDLPEPFSPSTPILAPGKNESEMSLRMARFGGTVFPTRFIVYTYWAMESFAVCGGKRGLSQARDPAPGEGRGLACGVGAGNCIRSPGLGAGGRQARDPDRAYFLAGAMVGVAAGMSPAAFAAISRSSRQRALSAS